MESAFTIVAPNLSASASATADLPLAVGPAMRSARLTYFPPRSGSVMSSVLVATLIADPLEYRLSEATLDRAAQALRGIERRRWLDEGVAADLVFSGKLEPKRAALEQAFGDEPVDLIVQPLAGR